MRPENTSAANRAFGPSSEDVAWASEVVDELGVNGERVHDGSDLPKLARARKIKRLADDYAER